MKKICLVSMPFEDPTVPNIQLASLKSYIKEVIPELKVDIQLFNLILYKKMGLEFYKESLKYYGSDLFIGDILFSTLLFPSNKKKIMNQLTKKIQIKNTNKVISIIKKKTKEWIKGIEWKDNLLVGFTCSYSQLFASIYAARLIKENNPSVKIVFGGNMVFGEMGKYLLNEFSEIDHIISGEGEISVVNLIQNILNNCTINQRYIDGSQHLLDLNDAPLPDYSDYFSHIKNLELPYPKGLMIYTSKGCSYDKCSFCNLNKQYNCYRLKKIDKSIKEIIQLQKLYPEINYYNFIDSLQTEKHIKILAKKIIQKGIEFMFFSQLNSRFKEETIDVLWKAGLRACQIGIEALDNNILKRMNKGVTVFQNIEIMKHLESLMIKQGSNVIINYDSATKEEVNQTIDVYKKLKYYQLLVPITMRYVIGTRDYDDLLKTNNYNFANEEMNQLIYPNISKYEPFMSIVPKKRTNKSLWKRIYLFYMKEKNKNKSNNLPGIYYKYVNENINVYFNYNNKIRKIKIKQELDIKVFLFCNHFKNIEEIYKKFNYSSKQAIEQTIKRLDKLEVILKVENKYITLPVRFNKNILFNLTKDFDNNQ